MHIRRDAIQSLTLLLHLENRAIHIYRHITNLPLCYPSLRINIYNSMIIGLDPPVVQIQPDYLPVTDIGIIPIPPLNPLTPSRKRPARTPGLTGNNAAFLVPDHIRKKFADGWSVHVPLTFLTDRGCLLKDKFTLSSSQDILSIDNVTGRILATSKPLSDDGELDLSFDEWHQAWRRLLELIKTFVPNEFLMWEVHYAYILNNDNRAELWPVYLAYDAEIRRRATQLPIDPSVFSIGIWNDLETRYTAKKVLSLIQADLKQLPTRSSTPYQQNPTARNTSRNHSFRNQQSQSGQLKKCIFCGDTAKDHVSKNCPAPCNVNGTP